MPATLSVRDETTSGTTTRSFTLEFPTESITVRELIKERIYQEVDDYNRRGRDAGAAFQGLVQPSETEVALNGTKPRRTREINWKAQFEKACDAYQKNQILVLAGNRQTESLDEVITITRGTEVTFLRLVMLVGG